MESIMPPLPVTVKNKRKRPTENLPRPHACQFEGCTKAFSRPDHLARHELNHNPIEVFTCNRCQKTFVRQDLLIRHVERHEKREAAPGGDVGGPQISRKRTKIASNGSPTQPLDSMNNNDLTTSSLIQVGPSSSLPLHHHQILGPSLIGSDLSTLPSWSSLPFPNSTQSEIQVEPPLAESSNSNNSNNNIQVPLQQTYDFFDTGLAPLTFPSTTLASEYNNPTITDQLAFPPTAYSTNLIATGIPPYLEDPLSNFIQSSYGAMNYVNYDWLFASDSNYDVTLMTSRPATPGAEFTATGMSVLPSNGGAGDLVDLLGAGFELEPFIWNGTTAGPPSVESNPAKDSPKEPTDRTTDISSATRARILSYLGPEWTHLSSDEKLSAESIREYLYLFWTRFDETQAPMFHRASFKTSKAPAALLIAMMLVGAFFSTNESHQLANLIHPSFRGKVLCSADFRPTRSKLWVHQTLVLVVVFGKLCSTRGSHEMSHIFWSSVVTLGRRSALFSVKAVDNSIVPSEDPEVLWAEWVMEESAKRIAFFTFSLDVEHAAFFRHSPALSAFHLQLTLPCSEAEWEAKDAIEWLNIHNESKNQLIPFISALKASLGPQGTSGSNSSLLSSLNSSSRVAVLHGLISVAQDLQWRDHVVGLGQPESRAQNWREMMSAAYNTWKAALDGNIIATDSVPTTQLLKSSISLYAVAHITLSIDIHELQIFAGAVSALGLVISDAVRDATRARMNAWAASKEGRAACWHSSFFLRSSLPNSASNKAEGLGPNSNRNSLHHGWCVYQSTLALYAFAICTGGKLSEEDSEGDDFKAKGMAYLDQMCTDSPSGLDDVPEVNDVLSVIATSIEYLQDSRWEITQEAVMILRRLLPSFRKRSLNGIVEAEGGGGGMLNGKGKEKEIIMQE